MAHTRISHITVKPLSAVMLVLFVLSLAPFASLSTHNVNRLRSVIVYTQQLQQSGDTVSQGFTSAFSKTVHAMNLAAGLNQSVSNDTSPSDYAKKKIVVPVQLPFLTTAQANLTFINVFQQLPAHIYQFIYKSHIITPEPPPPIFP